MPAQIFWDTTNNNRLRTLWKQNVRIPEIAKQLGCEVVEVRYQAAIVLKLPLRLIPDYKWWEENSAS